MKRYLLLPLAAIMASSCGSSMPVKDTDPTPIAVPCRASQPHDINMWINAMPGLGTGSSFPLLTTFSATTPTPGYGFALKLNRVMESYPEQVVLDLIVTPPAGIVAQVVTTSSVHITLPNFPGSEGSSVQVNCQDAPFFKVAKVMAAH